MIRRVNAAVSWHRDSDRVGDLGAGTHHPDQFERWRGSHGIDARRRLSTLSQHTEPAHRPAAVPAGLEGDGDTVDFVPLPSPHAFAIAQEL
jgi:hypothetical protein